MAEKPTALPAKTVHEKIKEAIKAGGLDLIDIHKQSTLDGDLYNVRIFDVRKDG